MGVGDSWGTREELLHPRDSKGRFRSKWKMATAAVDRLLKITTAFAPKTWPSDAEAGTYLGGVSKSKGKKLPLDRYTQITADARAGKASKDLAALQAAEQPLPEDLILSRVVDAKAFGLTPETIGQMEEYTGKLVADKAPSSTNVGTPIPKQPGQITLSIAAPKGTMAVIPGGGSREVILSPEQPLRITKVDPDGQGGFFVYAVAMPKGEKGNVRTKKLGTRAPTPTDPDGDGIPGVAPAAPGAPAAAPGAPAGKGAPRTEEIQSPSVGGDDAGTPAPDAQQQPTPTAPSPDASTPEPTAPQGQPQVVPRDEGRELTDFDREVQRMAAEELARRIEARAGGGQQEGEADQPTAPAKKAAPTKAVPAQRRMKTLDALERVATDVERDGEDPAPFRAIRDRYAEGDLTAQQALDEVSAQIFGNAADGQGIRDLVREVSGPAPAKKTTPAKKATPEATSNEDIDREVARAERRKKAEIREALRPGAGAARREEQERQRQRNEETQRRLTEENDAEIRAITEAAGHPLPDDPFLKTAIGLTDAQVKSGSVSRKAGAARLRELADGRSEQEQALLRDVADRLEASPAKKTAKAAKAPVSKADAPPAEGRQIPDSVRENLAPITMPELRQIAREEGIKVPSSVRRKADIVAYIKEQRANKAAPEATKIAPVKAAKKAAPRVSVEDRAAVAMLDRFDDESRESLLAEMTPEERREIEGAVERVAAWREATGNKPSSGRKISIPPAKKSATKAATPTKAELGRADEVSTQVRERKGVIGFVSDIDELVANEPPDDILRGRLTQALDRLSGSDRAKFADVEALLGRKGTLNRGELRRRLDKVTSDAGLRSGARPGETVDFDPKEHEALEPGLKAGDKVVVLKGSYLFNPGDGKDPVLVGRATVSRAPAGKVTPAKKAAPAKKAPAPTVPEAPVRVDRSLARNTWGGAHGPDDIHYHEDGEIGRAVEALGADARLEVGGDLLGDWLGHIATDTVKLRVSAQQQVQRVKDLASRLPEGSRARKVLDGLARRLDGPPPPEFTPPKGTPSELVQLYDRLVKVPAARRDPSRELEPLQELMELAAQGRVGPRMLINHVRALINRHHESEEGKFEIDRAIVDAARNLEATRAAKAVPSRPSNPTPEQLRREGKLAPGDVVVQPTQQDIPRVVEMDPDTREVIEDTSMADLREAAKAMGVQVPTNLRTKQEILQFLANQEKKAPVAKRVAKKAVEKAQPRAVTPLELERFLDGVDRRDTPIIWDQVEEQLREGVSPREVAKDLERTAERYLAGTAIEWLDREGRDVAMLRAQGRAAQMKEVAARLKAYRRPTVRTPATGPAEKYHISLDGIEDLADRVRNMPTGTKKETFSGGIVGEVARIEFPDGKRVFKKKNAPPEKVKRSGKEVTDAEQLASRMASAFKAPVPRVYRDSDDTIYTDWVDGDPAAKWIVERIDDRKVRSDFYQNPHEATDPILTGLVDSKGGRLLAILDTITGNSDRHVENWLVDERGEVHGIDHGWAFDLDLRGNIPPFDPDISDEEFLAVMKKVSLGAAGSAFAGRHIIDPRTGELRDKIPTISPQDLEELERRLDSLYPEFQKLGREAWFTYAKRALRVLRERATGKESIL